jgi:hypothetical protein
VLVFRLIYYIGILKTVTFFYLCVYCWTLVTYTQINYWPDIKSTWILLNFVLSKIYKKKNQGSALDNNYNLKFSILIDIKFLKFLCWKTWNWSRSFIDQSNVFFAKVQCSKNCNLEALLSATGCQFNILHARYYSLLLILTSLIR